MAPDKTFFNNIRGKYDPNKFAKWVVDDPTQHYVSMRDTGEMLYYEDGIYRLGGDRRIDELCVGVMDGVGTTEHAVRETQHLIGARVGRNREDVDPDPHIIVMENGLYNMETGEMSPYTPEYLSMTKFGINYDPDATCPVIDKFLNDVLCDPDTVQFVYEMFGYMLLSKKAYRTAVFLVGGSNGGKSTLMRLMQSFVPDASAVTPNQLAGDDMTAAYDIYNKRLNVVDDLGNTVIKEAGILKSIITGDPIRARGVYKAAFTYVPNALCVFGCNQIPDTTDKSSGFYSRFRVVEFPKVFEGKDADTTLPDRMSAPGELSGLFNKAVEAIRGVIERGEFTGNLSAADKERVYTRKADHMLEFVDKFCDISDVNALTPKDALYNTYTKWAKNHNKVVKDKGEMTQTLGKLSIPPHRLTINGERVQLYKGISIRPNMSLK